MPAYMQSLHGDEAPALGEPQMSGVLFYNSSNGEGATARLDGAGDYTFVGNISGFATWTHIVGTASGGLLFYNAANGDGAAARLDGAGHYAFVRNIPDFAKWTIIAGAGP
jgi:hypothetical protein